MPTAVTTFRGIVLSCALLCACIGPLDPYNPAPDSGSDGDDTTPGFPSGLLAWYPCNDSSTSLTDTTGNYPGQINSCTRDSGISGQALRFSGSSDVSMNDSLCRFGTGDFTVSLWVKPHIVASLTDSTQFNIISNGVASGSSESKKGFTVAITKKGCFSALIDKNSGTNLDTSVKATDQKWHHLALVRQKTTVRLYVDGKNPQTIESSADMTTGMQVLLGRDGDPNSRSDHYFTGLIDEVKIFNKAWDAAAASQENKRFPH